ncbi:MAG: PH domain-containing protein [Nocardioides sp.]
MRTPESDEVPVALREPAHQVSPRAVGYWRTSEAISTAAVVVFLSGVIAATFAIGALERFRPWVLLGSGLLLVFQIAELIWMPQIRFRIHRWEITPTAIHTRSGWLGREERIAPLSRVQTVDSAQGILMRQFRLATITVTTASAAGPIEIACLDEETARRTVADLTEYVGRATGDAT